MCDSKSDTPIAPQHMHLRTHALHVWGFTVGWSEDVRPCSERIQTHTHLTWLCSDRHDTYICRSGTATAHSEDKQAHAYTRTHSSRVALCFLNSGIHWAGLHPHTVSLCSLIVDIVLIGNRGTGLLLQVLATPLGAEGNHVFQASKPAARARTSNSREATIHVSTPVSTAHERGNCTHY